MRIQNIQKKLVENNLDAVVAFSEENIRYASAFYIQDGAVVVTREHAWLLTDGRYIEAASMYAKDVEVVLCDSVTNPVNDRAAALLSNVERIGMEEKFLPYSVWTEMEQKLGKKAFPAQNIFEELRMLKDKDEVDSIVKAQRIAEKAFDEILTVIRPGMTEQELAAELTYRMMKHGGERNSFQPICVAGTKTSMPHGEPDDSVLKAGDFVTMDFGTVVNGYCSDMTRTVALTSATDEMRNVYNTVLAAQMAGIAAAKGGAVGMDVHNTAAKVIADAGYGKYFTHGLGHSVGLQIHESPNFNLKQKTPVPTGAVVTVEPGIYIPGKFGVRIEDMVWLTEDGCIDLTEAPKDLIIVNR